MLKLVYWPSGILKKVSEPCAAPPAKELVDEMHALMVKHGGLGLSAIQVGLPMRFFLAKDRVFVNPEVTCVGPRYMAKEGCLSVPGFTELVNRSHVCQVVHGIGDQRTSEAFDGLMAQIIQHEAEHLDGKLFVDKLTSAKRSQIMGLIQALKRTGKLK